MKIAGDYLYPAKFTAEFRNTHSGTSQTLPSLRNNVCVCGRLIINGRREKGFLLPFTRASETSLSRPRRLIPFGLHRPIVAHGSITNARATLTRTNKTAEHGAAMTFTKYEDSRIIRAAGGDNNVTSRREQGISMQKPSSTSSRE